MTRTARTITAPSRRPTNQGSNWIRRAKRERIYVADSCECLYCGAQVAIGDERGQSSVLGVALATLDHVEPVALGGTNDATNLVTACIYCNRSKGDDELVTYLARANRTLLAILATATVSA